MRELIDRAALIAEYDRVHIGPPGEARKLMEDAPTIEERKKGKWYKPTGMMPPEYAGVYRCSECDELSMRDWKTHRQKITDFCPNCGARMGD